MQQIDMSNEKSMGIAYPPRPLAEPRSGRYAGCESAAGEVFGGIPHGCARAAGVGLPERSEPEGPQGAARECMLRRGTKTTDLAIKCDPVAPGEERIVFAV